MKVRVRDSDRMVQTFDLMDPTDEFPGPSVPASPGEGESEIELDVTVEEFVQACIDSQGGGDRPGQIFLHDTEAQATKTDKPAKKVGGKFVEAHIPHIPTAKERIIEDRKKRNAPLNGPVTLDELEMLNVR